MSLEHCRHIPELLAALLALVFLSLSEGGKRSSPRSMWRSCHLAMFAYLAGSAPAFRWAAIVALRPHRWTGRHSRSRVGAPASRNAWNRVQSCHDSEMALLSWDLHGGAAASSFSRRFRFLPDISCSRFIRPQDCARHHTRPDPDPAGAAPGGGILPFAAVHRS